MKKTALSLMVLLCSISFAQLPKSKDSLWVYLKMQPKDTNYVVALNEYAFLMVQEGKMDAARKYIAQEQKLSEKLNYGPGFCKVMNMYGVIEYSNQNPEKAMEYFLKARKLIRKYKLPKKFYQNSLNNIGIIYDQMGDRKNATKYAVELIRFQEKYRLEPFKTNPYYQLGSNLKFYKKYGEALQYFNKGLELEKEQDNLNGIAIAENNIGNVYDDLENTNEATRHYEAGLQAAQQSEYLLLQTDFLINLGRMYRKQGKIAKAIAYFRKAETICMQIEVTKPLKTAYQGLGDLYFSQKDYAMAEKYYLKSLEIAKTMEDNEYLYSITQNLADLYEATGDFKKAFYYKTDADNLKDAINKIDIAQNTEDLLRKYETGKKEQQIAIKNIQIKNADRQKWYFIGGILLLGVIGSLLFYQSRNRKKNNLKLQLLNQELDEANKTKTRFFSILNHDLRGPVSNLIHFLHLQKESPELLDAESKKRMEAKTISGAENLLSSMEDMLLWSKGQMENFKPQFKKVMVNAVFEDTAKHFSSEEKVSLVFENHDNIQIRTDENYLKTILRNLTGNAIKALAKTENPTIVWKAYVQDGQTSLSITDNGPGASQQQFRALYDDTEVVGIKTGLGLHLIRDLASAINCEILVDSNPQQGTTITLRPK